MRECETAYLFAISEEQVNICNTEKTYHSLCLNGGPSVVNNKDKTNWLYIFLNGNKTVNGTRGLV